MIHLMVLFFYCCDSLKQFKWQNNFLIIVMIVDLHKKIAWLKLYDDANEFPGLYILMYFKRVDSEKMIANQLL